MIDYSDEGWQGRNWITGLRHAACDCFVLRQRLSTESGSNDEKMQGYAGKILSYTMREGTNVTLARLENPTNPTFTRSLASMMRP